MGGWPPLTVYYLHTQLPSVSHYIAATCLLLQGDIIAITKKIDDNWYQGYLGDQKGIFPSAYVEVLEGTHVYTGMELNRLLLLSFPFAPSQLVQLVHSQ